MRGPFLQVAARSAGPGRDVGGFGEIEFLLAGGIYLSDVGCWDWALGGRCWALGGRVIPWMPLLIVPPILRMIPCPNPVLLPGLFPLRLPGRTNPPTQLVLRWRPPPGVSPSGGLTSGSVCCHMPDSGVGSIAVAGRGEVFPRRRGDEGGLVGSASACSIEEGGMPP